MHPPVFFRPTTLAMEGLIEQRNGETVWTTGVGTDWTTGRGTDGTTRGRSDWTTRGGKLWDQERGLTGQRDEL